jgi:hypothetical protein
VDCIDFRKFDSKSFLDLAHNPRVNLTDILRLQPEEIAEFPGRGPANSASGNRNMESSALNQLDAPDTCTNSCVELHSSVRYRGNSTQTALVSNKTTML